MSPNGDVSPVIFGAGGRALDAARETGTMGGMAAGENPGTSQKKKQKKRSDTLTLPSPLKGEG